MHCKRIIARLDVKGPNVVKGVHLEGLRIIGNPYELAKRYEEQGADEIIYIDTVASLYGRDNLVEIVKKTTKDIFIPITVGGGIRTLEDINDLLKCGADKVAINTAAINNPQIITKAAERFGSQCIVVSIEAKRREEHGIVKWEAYTENGRERTHKDVIEWIKEAIKLGAGEILLTSIDCEGVKKGFDSELIDEASKVCTIPLIISGGAGNLAHIEEAFKKGVDAVSLASVLHYKTLTVSEIKEKIKNFVPIRGLF
ncbi:MAG TPA: imidazole glycerol phosphate synthase subunit HisF [Alphaproteobacteria bacterium]|nr:imidazole glycerol phosphate synthase subunit HisF [Alphaproteobacteria bacterium]